MPNLKTTYYLRRFEKAVRKEMTARLGTSPDIRTAIDRSLIMRDVRVSRANAGFLFEGAPDMARGSQGKEYREKAVVYAYWMSFADISVRSIIGNVSDGQVAGRANFAFSSFDPQIALVPDAFFFRDYGYKEVRRQVADAPVAWQDRSDEIVWRGSITGEGIVSVAPNVQNNFGINQRVRMAVACKPLSIDFKFAGFQGRGQEPYMALQGLMGDPVPVDFWARHKFAIDIDGFSNAWCNFFRRLLQGNCVLKVDSNFGFKQWYYHQLEPYVHYVPVKADLSDLPEQLEWLRSNDAKAREIAAQGQQFAQSLTWESESKRAGQIITDFHGQTQGNK